MIEIVEPVRMILQWMACARRPLKKGEILGIWCIETTASRHMLERIVLRDNFEACGPFIEINKGNPRFVNFSAKE